jgi:hypothetical protein
MEVDAAGKRKAKNHGALLLWRAKERGNKPFICLFRLFFL